MIPTTHSDLQYLSDHYKLIPENLGRVLQISTSKITSCGSWVQSSRVLYKYFFRSFTFKQLQKLYSSSVKRTQIGVFKLGVPFWGSLSNQFAIVCQVVGSVDFIPT